MTDEHKAILIEKYPVLPMGDLLKILPYPKDIIKGQAQRLHICKKGRCFSWRYADELKLIELYPRIKNADLARMFNKTQSQVDAVAFKLGLFKDPEFKLECSRAGMFKKGSVPVNKGTKGYPPSIKPEAKKRMSSHQFKKGQKSITELYDGCIRVRTDKRGVAHKFIRLAKNNWKELQIHNYEQIHGPVPKGFRLRCISSDHTDCDLSNWELISIKEHMLRNCCSLNLTDGYIAFTIASKKNPELVDELKKYPDIINLKRSEILLNRAIKKHGNGNNETSKSV